MDGELLSGSLPVKKLKLLQAWMILHEDELYKAWNNTIKGIIVWNKGEIDISPEIVYANSFEYEEEYRKFG